MKRTGIYRLKLLRDNLPTMFYIGQAKDLDGRGKSHFRGLRKNRHDNPRLQYAYNKYGEQAIAFEVILICKADKEILSFYEQLILDSYPSELIFNIHRECVTSPLGTKRSLEQKAVLSAAKKGKPGHKHSKETCLQISETKKRKKQRPSPEAIEASRAVRINKPLSESTRLAISVGNTGKIMSLEACAAISAAQTKRYKSEQERALVSAQMLGNKHCLGNRHSNETKIKQKVAALRREAFWREHPESRPKPSLEACEVMRNVANAYWERWRTDPAVKAAWKGRGPDKKKRTFKVK